MRIKLPGQPPTTRSTVGDASCNYFRLVVPKISSSKSRAEFDQEHTGFITIDFLDPGGDTKVLSRFTNDLVVRVFENVDQAWKMVLQQRPSREYFSFL